MSSLRPLVLAIVAFVALPAPSAEAGPRIVVPIRAPGCNYDIDETNDLAFRGDASNRTQVLYNASVQSTGFFGNGGGAWELRHCVRITPRELPIGPLLTLAGTAGLVSQGISGAAANFVRVERVDETAQVIHDTTYVGLGGGVWELVGTADIDGDGAQDLVFAGRDGTAAQPFGKVEVLFGQNAGETLYFGLGGGLWDYAGRGDVDADGDDDLFFSQENIAIRISIIEDLAIDGQAFLPLGGGTYEISAIGDVTGDGKADLVLLAKPWFGTAKILELEDGVATNVLFRPTGEGTLVPRLLADTDANGAKDILFVGESVTRIDLMGNEGLELIDSGFVNNLGIPPVMTGDFDGDGRGDIASNRVGVGVLLTLLDGKQVKRRVPPPPQGDSFELVTD